MLIRPGKLRGRTTAVPSKSMAARQLFAAALGNSTVRLDFGRSIAELPEDIAAAVRAVTALGAEVRSGAESLYVTGGVKDTEWRTADCGESGTALRFLLPPAAVRGNMEITGRGRLPGRPIRELAEELRRHGAEISGDALPLKVSGGLRSGDFSLPGNVSSQYISGLLMALPLLEGDSTLQLTSSLESSPYVDMTLSVMRAAGITVEDLPGGWRVSGKQEYSMQAAVSVEGDWSASAVWLAAGALGGGVAVSGLKPDSLQGDRKIPEILEAFGANVRCSGGVVEVNGGRLHGITLDMGEIPDLFPVLCIVAACAEGVTRFVNCRRLRFKESDRLSGMAEMLGSFGISTEAGEDTLAVCGGQLRGGRCNVYGDHRLVMAAALAGAYGEGPVVIPDAEAVNKSYPGFFRDFELLGGRYGFQLG